jgi:beta-lactamase class C
MRFMFFILLSLAPLAVTHASDQLPLWSPVPGPAFTFQKEFDEYIGTVIAEDTPGIAITLIVDGKPLLTKGYGVSEVGGIDAIIPETVFRLASVSKTIASAAVGSLVQHNKLQWTNRPTPTW